MILLLSPCLRHLRHCAGFVPVIDHAGRALWFVAPLGVLLSPSRAETHGAHPSNAFMSPSMNKAIALGLKSRSCRFCAMPQAPGSSMFKCIGEREQAFTSHELEDSSHRMYSAAVDSTVRHLPVAHPLTCCLTNEFPLTTPSPPALCVPCRPRLLLASALLPSRPCRLAPPPSRALPFGRRTVHWHSH